MQILWKKYVKENFEMNVDECGIEQGIPGLGYNYEVLKNAVIHYVTKGYGTFKFNGKVFNLKQGDIFILLKGMQVEYVASIDDPWEYYWIGFSGSNANEYLNRTSITNSCVANCEENSKIPQIILNMCEISKTYNPSRSDDILLLKELYSLLYALIDLYKMFIKNLGISPQRYLINLRMYKATLLLKGTKLPIGEVASSVGYSDSLLFSKTFSKHFSMSPLNYRNNQVNKTSI